MLKKLLATIAVVTLFTVQVNAATNEVKNLSGVTAAQNELKVAYDELNYSLTVEWDQKDPAFRTNKMNEFSKTIRSLQIKGLTTTELIDFAKSQVKDAKIASDIDSALKVIETNKMSAEEANRYATEVMKKAYSTGASWQGRGNGSGLISLIILVGLLAVLSSSSYDWGTYCGYEDVYVCGYNVYNYYVCYYQSQYVCY